MNSAGREGRHARGLEGHEPDRPVSLEGHHARVGVQGTEARQLDERRAR